MCIFPCQYITFHVLCYLSQSLVSTDSRFSRGNWVFAKFIAHSISIRETVADTGGEQLHSLSHVWGKMETYRLSQRWKIPSLFHSRNFALLPSAELFTLHVEQRDNFWGMLNKQTHLLCKVLCLSPIYVDEGVNFVKDYSSSGFNFRMML